MALRATFVTVDIMDEAYDFNWAKIRISEPPSPNDGAINIEVKVQVPKIIKDLDAIRSYALDIVKKINLSQT